MKKMIVFITVIAGMIPWMSARAGIEAGDQEVGGSFSITKPSNGDAYWFLQGNYGLYYTDRIRLSGFVSVNGNGDTNGTFGGGINYLFPELLTPDLIPYVGGAAVITTGDIFDDSLGLNVSAGVKQFFVDNISLDYEARYQFGLSEIGDGLLRFTIGLSYYF